ncbi:MAG: CopG family transcriptional regulator [Halobacteriota archaeon]
MAEERGETLSDDLETWLDEHARERDLDRGELLRRAVVVYRSLDESADALAESGGVAADETADLAERLENLSNRVDAVEKSFEENLVDVRRRVVQVKRETDQKAPSDHDHPDLRSTVDETAADVAAVRDALDDLDRHVEAGFDNYEEIVGHLSDRADDIEDKLNRVASVVVDVRTRVRALDTAAANREAVVDLQRAANRHGEHKGTCGECGATVHVGLLDTPHCPQCDSAFEGFEPSPGFFRSATLTVGTPPALEAFASGATDASGTGGDDRV